MSAPAVVDGLLGRLDVRPGQRVLEIGTGSGFSGPDGLAMVTLDGRWVRDGAPATAVAEAWVDRWQQAGRPGMDRLRPVVVENTDGVLRITIGGDAGPV